MPPDNPRPSVRTSAVRSKIEHASHPVLTRLATLPAWAPLVFAALLAVVGLLLRGIPGAACFAILTLLLGWLLYLSWPRLAGLDRLMRLSVLLLTTVATIVLAAPR